MLLPILNLDLEKEISILEIVWKKSLILQPKICANPGITSSSFRYKVFSLAFSRFFTLTKT